MLKTELQSIYALPAIALVAILVPEVGPAHASDLPSRKNAPLFTPAPVASWSGFIAVGGAAAPDYEGSKTYQALPFAAARLQYGPYFLDVAGPQARLNLLPSTMFFAGPAVGLQLGRGDDVSDKQVKRLREIDASASFGGFVGLKFPVNWLASGDAIESQLTVLSGSDDGVIGTLSIGYSVPVMKQMILSIGASASAVSAKYGETYFSIDADNARRSGLAQYTAGEGLKDIGVNASLSYALDKNWAITARASYKRLMGDFADSPITKVGSADQFFAGGGVVYRW